MSSIFYLWKTTFKNRLLDLKNHPSHLVVTILVILFFGFALVSTVFTPGEDTPLAQIQNLPLLGAILIGLFLFLLVTQIQKGLSSGGELLYHGRCQPALSGAGFSEKDPGLWPG